MQDKRYTLEDLLYLMQRCAIPRKVVLGTSNKPSLQSFQPHSKKVYEMIDALERQDMDNLREELGDVLLHLVFYSQMASEQDQFTFADVAHGIVEKLVRRHPHVFPSGDLYEDDASQRDIDEKTLFEQWDRIKQAEKENRGQSQIFAGNSTLTPILHGIPTHYRRYSAALKSRKNWQVSASTGSTLMNCFPSLTVNCTKRARHWPAVTRRALKRKSAMCCLLW